MSKQIMVGMLANAEIDEAVTKGRLSFIELYRLVCSITNGDGLGASPYVYEDIIDGLQNALFVSVGSGDADYDADWVYLPNVDWIYPDTDDDDLYERLFDENVDELFDCLSCVECIIRISRTAAEFLETHTNEAVFYNTITHEYAWIIPFFGMPWSLVTVDVVSE